MPRGGPGAFLDDSGSFFDVFFVFSDDFCFDFLCSLELSFWDPSIVLRIFDTFLVAFWVLAHTKL